MAAVAVAVAFAGSGLTDTYTGSSDLTASGETYWETHHTYSVLWEPGEYVRWYLDDELLFEVNKEALREQVGCSAPRQGLKHVGCGQCSEQCG